ncbi:MAG: glycosyltransferase [Gammaproteobacteria bacterium]|nr:glycosyltransferase [Gammaproteobacteria bacterium]
MKKIRLAVVIPTLHGAGCERIVAELLPDLNKLFDIELILYNRAISYPVPEQIKIYTLNSDNSAECSIGYKMYRFAKRIVSLSLILRRENYEVILSFIDGNNIIVFFANILSGRKAKLVTAEHTISDDFFRFNRYARRLRWVVKSLLRFVYNRADKVIVISKAMQDYLRDNLGVKKTTDIIYNGIDVNRFYFPTHYLEKTPQLDSRYLVDGIRLLNVGRLDDNKNQRFLIEIFPRILESVPTAYLFIIGVGSNEESLRHLIYDMGLEERIYLLGWKNNVEEFMKMADVFLLTSHYESFSNVIMEALACGVPVVTTQSTKAFFETLDNGHFGTIVPVGDADAFVAAVLNTLSHYSNSDTFKMEISNHARSNFNIDRMKSKYIGVIQEVFNGK